MKISVIIPCLNAAGTLVEQLEALFGQDYSGEWELLVADNGSSDGTAELVESYRSKLPRLRFVDASARRGQAPAWRATAPGSPPRRCCRPRS